MSRRGLSILTALLLLLCALILSSVRHTDAVGSRPDKAPATTMPFEHAEQLVYEGEFSKLMLRGIKIAELRFTARRAPTVDSASTESATTTSVSRKPGTNGDAPLVFVSDVQSRGWFRKLFGINFHYLVESTVEPSSHSILRTTKLDQQGERVRTSEAIFDRVQNKVAWVERDPRDPTRPPRVVNAPINGAAHDLISVIYYLRTQTLTPGQSFALKVSDSGGVYDVPATVFAEPKKMKSILGRVRVVRVGIDLFGKERLVDREGTMSIWVTDDARHVPIRARISTDLGTLDITLKKMSR